MIDCEMSGLRVGVDELLQVSAVILRLDGIIYTEERHFDTYLHTKNRPVTDFDSKYLSDIYHKCNGSPDTPASVYKAFKEFIGTDTKLVPCGDCVITDLEFLYNYGILDRNYYEGDTSVEGTLDYEIFDLNALKCLSRTKKGFKSDKSLVLDSGIHNALVDCRNQTLELNHYLEVLLRG